MKANNGNGAEAGPTKAIEDDDLHQVAGWDKGIRPNLSGVIRKQESRNKATLHGAGIS